MSQKPLKKGKRTESASGRTIRTGIFLPGLETAPKKGGEVVGQGLGGSAAKRHRGKGAFYREL